MSREVRRVPVGWEHPDDPLMGDYPGSLKRWRKDGRKLRKRKGWEWRFHLEYHLTGYQGRDDTEPTVHPWTHDGARETDVETVVRDEDHLLELLLAKHAGEEPDPADYMPVFDVSEEDLGWCLYETVSEGSPVTPVFATADELVEHLVTVGQDWSGPMRREAAQTLVSNGHSLGSFIVAGGTLLRSDMDADLIEGLLKKEDD